MLGSLLYVSQITASAASRLPSVMEDILISSARHNRTHDLTGFLLCDGETFAQALEGPDDALEACFGRIALDRRHQGLTVRLRKPTSTRRFARWSMCGLYLSPLDEALLTPAEIDFDLLGASPGALMQHLHGLATAHGLQLDAEHERLIGASSSSF